MYMSGSDVYTSLVHRERDRSGLLRVDGAAARRRRLPACSPAARSRGRSSPTPPSRAEAARQVDRLLLHVEADRPGRRGRRCPDARRQRRSRSARRRCRSSARRAARPVRRLDRPTTSTCRRPRWPGSPTGIFDQPLVPEPPSHAQEMYAILDTVVQAVLTDKNADIDGAAHPGRRRRDGARRGLTVLAPERSSGVPGRGAVVSPTPADGLRGAGGASAWTDAPSARSSWPCRCCWCSGSSPGGRSPRRRC